MDENATVFAVRKIAPNVHAITELNCVHCYLVEGREWAVLIDSGLGRGNIRAAVEQITDRPVIVVNTHGHPDHVGGNYLFESAAIHSAEAEWLERSRLYEGRPTDRIECMNGRLPIEHIEVRPRRITYQVSHGETLDLGGGSVLEVWHTPGHTPGSICLVDEASRFVFTGDTVYAGPLALCFDESDLQSYAESITGLEAMGWDTNLVLPAHGETPLDGGILLEVGSGVRRLLDGEGRYEKVVWNGQPIFDVGLGRFSIRLRQSLSKT